MEKGFLLLLLTGIGLVAQEGKVPAVTPAEKLPSVEEAKPAPKVPFMDIEPYKGIIRAFKAARETTDYTEARDTFVTHMKNFAKIFLQQAVVGMDEEQKKIVKDIAEQIKTTLDEIEKAIAERTKPGLSEQAKKEIDKRLKENLLTMQFGLMFATMPFAKALKEDTTLKMSEEKAREAGLYWIQTVLSVVREMLAVVGS